MYVVMYGEKVIYKPGIKETAATELHLSETESSPAEFSFYIPKTNLNSGILEVQKEEIVVYDTNDEILTEENEIFRGKIVTQTNDFYGTLHAECKSVMNYLYNSIQRPSEHHNETVEDFLQFLLDNHNAQVNDDEKIYLGAVTVHDSNDSIYRYTNYETTMDCIKDKLLDVLGGRIVIRRSEGRNYLDYLAEYTNTNNQSIEFGKNLLDFSKNIDASDFYTVCIPLGAMLEESPIEALNAYLTIEEVNDGKDYVENPETVSIYGRRVQVVYFDDVTIPENLKVKGEQWLKDQLLNITIEVTAVDLSMTNENFDSFKLGDEVLVNSKPHAFSQRKPVTKRDRYLDGPDKNKITMGSAFVGGIVGNMQAIEDSTRQQFSRIISANSVLQKAKRTATELIKAATNGYVVVSPDEILVMDTPSKETAKKVWRWNVSGLGYSSTGYNGTYGTAITMDGSIVADYITAGILSGIIVRSIDEKSMTELSGAKTKLFYDGVQIGQIGPLTDGEKEFAGIMAAQSSGGVEIGIALDDFSRASILERFTCEDNDRTKGYAEIFGRRDVYGTLNLIGNRINFQSEAGEFRGGYVQTGNNGDILLCGKSGSNKVALGYCDSETSGAGAIVEASTAWTDGYRCRIQGGARIIGDFTVSGTKNRRVDVGDKHVLMNAYETTECMFGDMGTVILDETGHAHITLDEEFRKTIEGDYYVFVNGYEGPVAIKSKTENGFDVTGNPGSRVDFEIKAHQKGYTDIRMKEDAMDEKEEQN